MSIVKRTVLAAGSLLSVAAMQLPAHADTLYSWSFTADPNGITPQSPALPSTLSFSGTLSVESDGTTIDGITVAGATTGLYTGSAFSAFFGGQDNQITFAPSMPFLDGLGLSFTYQAGNTNDLINIYGFGSVGGTDDYFETVLNATTGNLFTEGSGEFTVTPLPASWSMILSGLAFVAFFAYRRSSKVGNTFA